MAYLPVPTNDVGQSLSPRQAAKASRAVAKYSLRVLSHSLEAQAMAEEDRQDSQAVADASRTALEEELDLLDYGLSRAGQSAARAELVARHVERLSAINNRRLSRRFGA